MMHKVLILLFMMLLMNMKLQAQELTMFQGFMGYEYYEDEQRLNKADFIKLLSQDTEAHQKWLKSQRNLTLGWLSVITQFGMLAWYVNRNIDSRSTTAPLIGFSVATVAGLGYGISANKLRRDAILRYNANLPQYSLHLGPTQHGIGLTLQF